MKDDAAIARIVASRLAKWLEESVLAGQEILVDAPHLASRYPSLLLGARRKRAAWDSTAALGSGSAASGLRERRLRAHRFPTAHWLSRPAWFWLPMTQDNSIVEVASPWDSEAVPFCFCEDLSRFLPEDQCREFRPELSSPFNRRFVSRRTPRKSAARGAIARARDVGRVQYFPADRFAR